MIRQFTVELRCARFKINSLNYTTMEECSESLVRVKDKQQAIRECAYLIWLEKKRENATANWYEAEKRINEQQE